MAGEKIMRQKKYPSRGSAIGRNVSKINGKLVCVLFFRKKASAFDNKFNLFLFYNI